MAIPIPSPLVEFLLLGPLDDRRQLQDSPILGDVWVEYGRRPDARLDLLIVPFRAEHPGAVAASISDALGSLEGSHDTPPDLPTWKEIQDGIHLPISSKEAPKVAFLQGLVVARLSFDEVLEIVAPKTNWWIKGWSKVGTTEPPKESSGAEEPEDKHSGQRHEVEEYDVAKMTGLVRSMFRQALAWNDPAVELDPAEELKTYQSFERFLILIGLILWARRAERPEELSFQPNRQVRYILDHATPEDVATEVVNLAKKMMDDETSDPLVWQISLNRRAMPALSKSVPAVKGDAAKTLFNVDCSSIGWAVIDSGIDAMHPAFMKGAASRVKRSFDFKNFRQVVSLSNDRPLVRRENLSVLLGQDGLLLTQPLREAAKRIAEAEAALKKANENRLAAETKESQLRTTKALPPPHDPNLDNDIIVASGETGIAINEETIAIANLDKAKEDAEAKQKEIIKDADDSLQRLAVDARKKGPIHWELVEKFVEISPGTKPQTSHGTHVAGIIGASKSSAVDELKKNDQDPKVPGSFADGMCPDISLYDFRVLGRDLTETEFAIIAALQFIRYLNDRDNLFTIHGANLSLSIPHDVRNFACGRTPICDECERLISSGVVVVAAAGNHGYKSFQTADGAYDSYAAFSITDPGNAENVLTVGATHRFWPHTYGVSFFSSRGPTGDGRLKPDLVAPGERIRSTLPENRWGDLDGTSMAAPHASGAAAMLMARYSELVGQPMRVKRILCDSATDLGRERSFQGRGMLDVLRSFQSI